MWTRSACPGTSSVTRKYLSSASLGKKSRTPTMLGWPGIELSVRYAVEMRSRCFSRSSGGLYGSAWYARMSAVAFCPAKALNARYSM